ncbi:MULTISPECIES: tRNA-(ms[2]io[6]A)-hydroxylase [unclassified Emticicia]|uniref:tRNA-(ms[2]io[6]A)-hydroxylase n=1 Tax=unclassified Emticicia TaxID=2627301 RepID=UPI000C78E365|nr:MULTISPECIES: tRNA-(ms[2]io[6]A)-hydroxylase [unclassified Emticicia]PLK42277.1 tRNA 2-methylthio-N6-isopentenyl adenosine(37) hydroxylase MiaE [Emticicia sp. TH156]UTA69844.1 tRNA-(ms[2]io[6]A)-hydroxylase [Emticicia sp. 21SJ11W-3]
MQSLTTLGLKLPTDPRWVDIAEMNLADILIDHAFCEQKAASSCISLIVRYPEKEKLVETLTPVVAEEWGHFQRVLKEMRKRGIKLSHKRKDEYVEKLQACITKTSDNGIRLMEQLLICALIEARSAERFKLLSENIADESLRKFYHELMISEAGHYRNFIELAEEYMPKEQVRERWVRFLEQEAEIMKTLEVRKDRFH